MGSASVARQTCTSFQVSPFHKTGDKILLARLFADLFVPRLLKQGNREGGEARRDEGAFQDANYEVRRYRLLGGHMQPLNATRDSIGP